MDEMNPFHRRLAMWLTYAGILPPWLALAIAQVTDVPWLGFVALIYGAVIASFVCGMQWSTYLHSGSGTPVNLLITSNAGALIAWVLVVASLWSNPLAFAGLALLLLALLYIDRRSFAAGVLPSWFWPLRRNATIGLGAGLFAWALLG